MKMNMGVVVGGPALAAVAIAGGLAWATILAAKNAAPDRGAELAQACAGEDRDNPGSQQRPCPEEDPR